MEELNTETTERALLDAMPAHARLWIYKTTRALSQAEVDLVHSQGVLFTTSWTAHGAQMHATVEVRHERFVIIAADEQAAGASGCSIDTSVAFIKSLEQNLNITLTDRMLLIYEKDEEIRSCKLDQLSQLIEEGELDENTMVFDDLLTQKGDLDERFRIPLSQSWAIKFAS